MSSAESPSALYIHRKTPTALGLCFSNFYWWSKLEFYQTVQLTLFLCFCPELGGPKLKDASPSALDFGTSKRSSLVPLPVVGSLSSASGGPLAFSVVP